MAELNAMNNKGRDEAVEGRKVDGTEDKEGIDGGFIFGSDLGDGEMRGL